jgi:hypothetical protein
MRRLSENAEKAHSIVAGGGGMFFRRKQVNECVTFRYEAGRNKPA